MTPSSFSPSRALAYHQKADQDRVTHAYTIGQEMTVSKSTVKASLINVGMMKAKLSLKGILNQWHLNCLCWDRSQKSRTLSNTQWRISQRSDFLSGVNNTICRDIFIYQQSLQRASSPLTRMTYSLISIWPCSASCRSFSRTSFQCAIPTVATAGAVATVSTFASQTNKRRIILTSNLKAGHWLISLNLTDLTFLFNLRLWYTTPKNPDLYTTRAWPHVCRSWKGLHREGSRKHPFKIFTTKKYTPKTKQVIKSDLTKCSWSLKSNDFSVLREPTAAQVKTDQSHQLRLH